MAVKAKKTNNNWIHKILRDIYLLNFNIKNRPVHYSGKASTFPLQYCGTFRRKLHKRYPSLQSNLTNFLSGIFSRPYTHPVRIS